MKDENSIQAVIIDTRRSPYARLSPVSISAVQLEPGFWGDRLRINRETTIPSQYNLLVSTGRLDNFSRAAGKLDQPYQGYVYNDSDVYKWLEAASWSLINNPEYEIHQMVEHTINLITAAQDTDGYINTYFSCERKAERWTNLQDKHELYCAGHLIQAAIAHYRSTGKNTLLNVAVRLADHLYSLFGPSRRVATGGHPEIEMALVELFRTVGNPHYLELAGVFIDRRGHGSLGGREYLLDHQPIREMERLSGHAVRALYLCSGAADLVLETGEQQLQERLDRLWSNLVHQQMYITGGVGSRYDGESIGAPYELPNARAYAETCAAIGSVMWNWRLLQLEAQSRYADLMEWTLYNAVLPGISLDGKEYFYVNPLEDQGATRRQAWFDCACCPPNISRTLAMLPGYIYSVSPEGIWFHQYISSQAVIQIDDHRQIRVHQVTEYPWSGRIQIEVTSVEAILTGGSESPPQGEFSLFLRLPAWAKGSPVGTKINGQDYQYSNEPGSYLEFKRAWKAGDSVELDFPMEVRYYQSHPRVKENSGCVAITRGPLVYCMETVDNQGRMFSDIRLIPSAPVSCNFRPDLLNGVVQLEHHGRLYNPDVEWNGKLYSPVHKNSAHRYEEDIILKSIPYYSWANRESGAMQIWHLIS